MTRASAHLDGTRGFAFNPSVPHRNGVFLGYDITEFQTFLGSILETHAKISYCGVRRTTYDRDGPNDSLIFSSVGLSDGSYGIKAELAPIHHHPTGGPTLP